MPKTSKTSRGGEKGIERDAATGTFITGGRTSGATPKETASPKSRSVIKESSSIHRDALKRLVDR